MSITITKRGTHPAEVPHKGKCRQCGTEVTYHTADITEWDQRDNSSWIRCPVCKGPIYHKSGSTGGHG